MARTSSIYDHFDLYLTPVTSTFNPPETRNVTVCNKCPRRPLILTLIPGCDLEHSPQGFIPGLTGAGNRPHSQLQFLQNHAEFPNFATYSCNFYSHMSCFFPTFCHEGPIPKHLDKAVAKEPASCTGRKLSFCLLFYVTLTLGKEP